MDKKYKWINIRLPLELHDMVKSAAETDHLSRSLTQFTILALADRARRVLGKQKSAEMESEP